MALRGQAPPGAADTADEEIELLTRRLTPGSGGYVVLIIAGIFVPVIAVVGYLGIALFYLLPFRSVRPFRRGDRPLGRRPPQP